jgi:predicted dehydrogenase
MEDLSGMASSRLRLAVIGVGMGSVPHFKSLLDLAHEAEIVWVYARDATRLAAAQLPQGVNRTTRL